MIQVEDLHHIAINVTDLERAVEFYKSVLGLKEIERPGFDFPGAWFALGDRQLHLMVVPDSRTMRGTTDVHPQEGHFALRVKSYSKSLERIKEKGIPYRDFPHGPTPWPQIHLTDPDGNIIELNASILD